MKNLLILVNLLLNNVVVVVVYFGCISAFFSGLFLER